MRLLLTRPELANRDCTLCQRYAYSEDGPVYHRDQPRLRLHFERPDCQKPGGCAKGSPENQRSLSPANLLCYRHYQRCKITGQWPDDTLVIYHARIISEIEREVWEAKKLAAIRTSQ